jgi:hypothetical protein
VNKHLSLQPMTQNIPLRSTLTTLQWMANHVNPFVTLTLPPTQS